MQAASVDLQSVLRWLTGTRGIAIHEEWLRACVEWILSEEVHTSYTSLTPHAFYNFIINYDCLSCVHLICRELIQRSISESWSMSSGYMPTWETSFLMGAFQTALPSNTRGRSEADSSYRYMYIMHPSNVYKFELYSIRLGNLTWPDSTLAMWD